MSLLKETIVKLLTKAGILKPVTVETILADLTKVTTELVKVAEVKKNEAAVLALQADQAKQESEKAQRVANRINGLTS